MGRGVGEGSRRRVTEGPVWPYLRHTLDSGQRGISDRKVSLKELLSPTHLLVDQ